MDCPQYQPYSEGFAIGWITTRASILTMYLIINAFVKPQGKYVLYAKAPILILSMMIMCLNFFYGKNGDGDVQIYILTAASCLEFFG
jgi:hypothetical protein